MTSRTKSPPSKRIKLEFSSSPSPDIVHNTDGPDLLRDPDDSDVEQCSICLQPLADRTIIPVCSHEFCFECLLVWTEQSRKCPLCSQTIGDYLIHHIRSKYDYQKHYLTPLRTSPRPPAALSAQNIARRRAQTRREQEWGRRRRWEQEEADELERAIERRRWVYRHGLYAKHVASNPYTRYKPFPTPAQFAASPDHISRATIFLRRELRVWVGLDVEFLTTFTISLMKSLDIRSEPAVRLLAEFLDMDSEGSRVNAEHFAHELYSFMRSPFRELALYDKAVQYDVPEDLPPPSMPDQRRRWRPRDSSRSRSRSRSVASAPRRRRSESRDSSTSSRSYSRSRSISRSPPFHCSSRTKSRSASREVSKRERRRQPSHTRQDRYKDTRPSLHYPGSARRLSTSRREEPPESPERRDDRRKVPAVHDSETTSRDGVQRPPNDHKGKRRAVDDENPRPTPRDPSPHLLHSPSRHATPPPQTAHALSRPLPDGAAQPTQPTPRAADKPRPVPKTRNRGLLESVHAHLAGRSSQHDREGRDTVPRRVRELAPQSSSTPMGEPRPSSSRDSGTESVPCGRPSLLERLSDSPSLPPSSSQSTRPSTPGDVGFTSVTDDSRASQVLQARTKLLSKLAVEKCLRESSDPAGPSNDSDRVVGPISAQQPASNGEITTDGTAAAAAAPLIAQEAADKEAKLRSQALLRVRLAAAKKAASARNAEVAHTTLTGDVLSKERMLKARLMQRRG
ncbi:hypothetical protein OBBRIDRAFT_791730 [Obba rivulosa]|uniref:RING-type E3 ubiquitin transferase n=1 Tax=Obba rivulosa TaxID=1052685 RepID=A0A8E2DLV7_9APHY|nr:hypothetical protein OBBRIDRAFT_791730 [Obba rivulosa]